MVQVNDKYGENIVNFPKNQNLEGDLILTLHSELTQKTYTFNVADEGNSKRFYKFIVDFSEVDNGEYDYSINGLETGLIRIGLVSSSTPEVIEYTDEVDIIQYREDRSSQYRLQNKEVTYEDNGQYLVTPDYDYYGLKNVIVNVSIDVDEYYQEGYTSGVTDGYVSGKTDGYNSGYTEGYESGSTDGKVIGYESGYTDGYSSGSTDGYNSGYTKGVEDGGASGYTLGYNSGYTDGFATGYTSGSTDGYNSGYTKGYTSGSTDGYNSGYTSGKTDGIAEQKSKLIGLNITSNGNYIRSDGYSAVTVNVPTGSTINNQNKNINIVNNGTTSVTFDSGYTGLGTVGINVNVPTGSTINNQTKGLNITANTVTAITYDAGYTGLEKVNLNVNIPQTGHTDEEMEQAYESGYTSGYSIGYVSGRTEGYQSGYTAGYDNGYDVGYSSGNTDGKVIGYESGYTDGYSSGSTDGYNSGYTNGYDSGYTNGYSSGETVGYQSGYTEGWSEGYASGRTDAVDYFTITVNFTNATPYLVNRAGFVINYLDRSDSYTYTGSSITAEILPGASFIIIFNEVENYEKPNNVTGISSWGGNASYNVEYIENIDYTKIPLTFNVVSAGKINFLGGGQYVREVEYKVNDGEWTVGYFTPSTASTGWTSINVNAGDLIQLRGNNASYADSVTNGCKFTSTARYNAYGNIMSLINSTSFSGLTSVGTLAFAMLFSTDGVVSAENLMLPATTLGQSCYYQMFQNCSTLTVAPQLPATIMANGCYGSMFYSCSSLTTAPDISHITTLEYGCCDKMFRSSGIQSIVVSPATPISYCYNSMFYNCTSLAYIKCLTTSPNTSHTWDWVRGVAANGTFVKKQGVTWESGNNGIPTGWTVLEEE